VGGEAAAFTDLLLHDLGEGLADPGPAEAGLRREWRTAPLWGLGAGFVVAGHDRLLHDGRARGIVEAILWHGGEAEAARRRFSALPAARRAVLVAWLVGPAEGGAEGNPAMPAAGAN
jgi:CxxC motif-containing protein (DUF1111 family)